MVFGVLMVRAPLTPPIHEVVRFCRIALLVQTGRSRLPRPQLFARTQPIPAINHNKRVEETAATQITFEVENCATCA